MEVSQPGLYSSSRFACIFSFAVLHSFLFQFGSRKGFDFLSLRNKKMTDKLHLHPIDTGRHAWLTTFGAFWSLFITFGWVNSLGVFQSYYERSLLSTYTPSTISWIASVQQCLIYSGGIFLGKLFDNYGPNWLLTIGGFLQVFGLMMTSISTTYYQVFLAQGVCTALGASAVLYGTLGALATWWKVRKGFAYGIVTSGSSIGGIVFPVMVNRLLPRIGFGWTMRAVAFIVLFGAVVAASTIRSNREHTPTSFSLQTYTSPLKDKRFTLLCFAMTIFGFGLFLPFNFIPSAAQSLGMTFELSVYTIAILNALSIFGRIIPGLLADRFGRFNSMTLCTFFSALITLALWIPGNSNSTTIAYAAIFGFFSGSYVSLTPTLVVAISPPEEIGHRTGILYFFISAGVLAGSPIAGKLVEVNGGEYTYLKTFAGVMMGVGAGFIAVLLFYIENADKGELKMRTEEGLEENVVL